MLPGNIRQIGHVVPDLDAALADWVRLGVGPWFVIRGLAQRVTYRGAPCEVTLSVAPANSGDLQIELIAPHGNTASIFTEFLDTHGPGGGFHQLAYWTEDFEATMAEIADAWPVVWSGGEDGGVRFAYVEPPVGATIVEIMELTEASAGMASLVRQAAADWDGTDPIRELG